MATGENSSSGNTGIVAIVAIVLLVLVGFVVLRGGFGRRSGAPELKGKVDINLPTAPSGGGQK